MSEVSVLSLFSVPLTYTTTHSEASTYLTLQQMPKSSFLRNVLYSHVQLLSQFSHVYNCTSCNARDQINVFDKP